LLEVMMKLKQILKKLQSLVKTNEVEIWSLDECHFQQHGSRCKMWVPPEDKDPIVLQEPTRKNISVFGAACVHDGRLVTKFSKPFNGMTFQEYLELLLNHKKDRLEKHSDEIKLDFLPPYSPDLNPIERVWKLTRRLCTHNRYFESIEILIESVTKQFKLWQSPNNILRSLCAIN
jgi:transposase